jgi:hypothetical protein
MCCDQSFRNEAPPESAEISRDVIDGVVDGRTVGSLLRGMGEK